jgi:hypothetical protein
LILNTYIIKKRVYKRKRSRKSEQTYKEIINILLEAYYIGPAITGPEKEGKRERERERASKEKSRRKGKKESGWDQV